MKQATGKGAEPGMSSVNEEPQGGGGEAGARPSETLPGIEIDGSVRAPRVSSGTVFLVGALVIAAGLLAGMRYVGLGPKGASAKMAFDDDLLNSASMPVRDHRVVLGDLNASRIDQQVPDSSIKRNPFKLAGSEVTALPEDDAAKRSAEDQRRVNEQRAKDLAARTKQVDDAFKMLALHGVMGGSVPLARINNKTIKLGEKLGPFLVTKIAGRTVELEADARVFRLELAEGGAAGERSNEPLMENGFPWNVPTPPSQTGEPAPK